METVEIQKLNQIHQWKINVHPKPTPKIKGIVFMNPKLKPECEAIILLGPGM